RTTPSATSGRDPRRARRRSEGSILVYLIALVVVALTLGPVLYAVLGGFRSNAQLAADPAGLPDPWVGDNYRRVVTGEAFWNYAVNSVVVALITTVVTVICGLMAAYPLARYQFRWREPLFMVF